MLPEAAALRLQASVPDVLSEANGREKASARLQKGADNLIISKYLPQSKQRTAEKT